MPFVAAYLEQLQSRHHPVIPKSTGIPLIYQDRDK